MTYAFEGQTLARVTGRGAARDTRRATPAEMGLIADLEINHGQGLFGFVRRLGLSDDQAADAVQEVLARLLEQFQRGTRIEVPRAWAYRAIYRLAMDEHRLRRRALGLVDLLSRFQSREASPDQSDRIAVWSEVDRLPARQRQVLYLRYRSDLTYEEIGEVLGITASGARSHATQALATLRRQLTAGDGER